MGQRADPVVGISIARVMLDIVPSLFESFLVDDIRDMEWDEIR